VSSLFRGSNSITEVILKIHEEFTLWHCYELRGGLALQYRGATVPAVLFTWRGLRGRAARVAEALGTPAAGLRPRPAREKGFPSNLLLDLIDTSPLFK
jgi:hypothetical protein